MKYDSFAALWAPLTMLALLSMGVRGSRVPRQTFELAHSAPPPPSSDCVTPEGGEGTCGGVVRCPPIRRILDSRPIPRHMYEYLKLSICDRESGGRPKFCCPNNGIVNTAKPTTQEPITVSDEAASVSSVGGGAVSTSESTQAPSVSSTMESSSSTEKSISSTEKSISSTVDSISSTEKSTPTTEESVSSSVSTSAATSPTTPLPEGGTNPHVLKPPSSSEVGETESVVTEAPVELGPKPAVLPPIEQCGKGNPPWIRIVGGRITNPGDWPWMAALGYEDPRGKVTFACGAVLVSTRHVITAAHCVKEQPGLKVVRLGDYDLAIDNETNHEDLGIEKEIVHEGYDSTYQNDIAILKLDREVVFRDEIKPVCLPDPSVFDSAESLKVGVMPVVAGWGAVGFNARSSDVLKDLQIPIVSTESCAKSYARFKTLQVDHRTLCAGYGDGGQDACQGDSGGPLFHPALVPGQDLSQYFLVGVVSLGFRCAEPGYPGIYSRATHFLPWLYNNLN